MKVAEALSWEPVRRGDVYCAPACGRDCTKAEHDKAAKEGAKLAKKLGPGWTPRVWENLGWHYNAVSPCGRLKVHPCGFKKSMGYSAFLGEKDCGGGTWAENGDTPQEAIDAVLVVARAQIAELSAHVEGL